MSKEILSLVEVLAKEKNLDKEIIFIGLEKALTSAVKKMYINEFPEIIVNINRINAKYDVIRKWIVVHDDLLQDKDKEITFSIAQDKYNNVTIGLVVEEPINFDLGRISAQTVRNVIAQHIRVAEREQLLREYLYRNRGIVIGKVRKFEHGNIVLDCGKGIEAILFAKVLMSNEIFQIGERIKAYLDKDNLETKHGRIIVSRSNPNFVAKLLENNVPEISSGKVQIKAIARVAGIRTKVAVYTDDIRIDAKGSCIGFRNQRIDSVVKEINDEKIDIIDYNVNLAQYTINALSPAEIDSVIVYEDKKIIEVTVDDDKLAIAIGENGINIKLASELIGYTINIYGKSFATTKHADERVQLINKFNFDLDIDDEISELLIDNGFTSLEEIAYVDSEELLSIKEFDQDIVKELQERASNKLLSQAILYKNEINKLEKDLSKIAKLSQDMLLKLIKANILDVNDIADLSSDELIEITGINQDTANKLVIASREALGYFHKE